MPEIRYGTPVPMHRHPHVVKSGSCSVNGYSTWGYRVECTGCGAVDACSAGSSVSYEDGPPRFAYDHRECAPVPYEATDAFGRIL